MDVSKKYSAAEKIFPLIQKEFELAETKQSDIAEVYPKLVVCTEFFRYIRGEFFHTEVRKNAEEQKAMYQMEKQLMDRLSALKKTLNTDQRTQYYLETAKKLFD